MYFLFSVLVFPPVSNHRRFLIHKTAEELRHPGLVTFSIGRGDARRTVVCYDHQIIKKLDTMVIDEGCKTAPSKKIDSGGGSSGVYRPPQARMQSSQQPHREAPVRVRRPDRAVYVPKARRSTADTSADSIVPVSPSEITPITCDEKVTAETKNNHVTTRPGRSKKPIDKNFCNVYKPPHARSSNFDTPTVKSALDDSPPRVSDCVPQQMILNNIVPNSEYSLSPLVNNIEIETSDNNLASCLGYAIDPASSENDIIVSNLPKVPLDTALCLNNVFGNTSPVVANIERADNIAVDSAEHVECLAIHDTQKNSHSNNNFNLNMENEDRNYASPDSDVIIPNENQNSWDCKKDEDKEQNELIKASEEINRSNRRLIKQSFVSDVLHISSHNGQDNVSSKQINQTPKTTSKERENKNPKPGSKAFNPDEEEWEAMFDENRDWLGPELVEELTTAVGRVAIQKPKMSYSNYLETAPKGFSHVLEVYNFPSEFTNNDLLNVFSDFKDSGFEIKWVDDNHALVVFSSPEIAAQVLAYNHPMVKTRPLYEATHESRAKAKKSAEFLKPYKARPETCTALARRLVSGALGVKLPNQAQERLEEKEKISLARKKKRLAALHREAAWDGSLTSDM